MGIAAVGFHVVAPSCQQPVVNEARSAAGGSFGTPIGVLLVTVLPVQAQRCTGDLSSRYLVNCILLQVPRGTIQYSHGPWALPDFVH